MRVPCWKHLRHGWRSWMCSSKATVWGWPKKARGMWKWNKKADSKAGPNNKSSVECASSSEAAERNRFLHPYVSFQKKLSQNVRCEAAKLRRRCRPILKHVRLVRWSPDVFCNSVHCSQVSVESCPVNCIYWVDYEELEVLEFLARPQPKAEYGVFGGGWERPPNIFSAAKSLIKQLKQEAAATNHGNWNIFHPYDRLIKIVDRLSKVNKRCEIPQIFTGTCSTCESQRSVSGAGWGTGSSEYGDKNGEILHNQEVVAGVRLEDVDRQVSKGGLVCVKQLRNCGGICHLHVSKPIPVEEVTQIL